MDILSLSTGDSLLDRFRINAAHQGGMGLLWTVTDRETGRAYAIKTIRPELAENEAVREAFRRESDIWIDLDHHEHLVQALWVDEVDGAPFLILEHVDGADLGKILESGALSTERALDLAMQCASGLAYAHSRAVSGGVGVVHRDLKPSNLLVSSEDLLKVSDFGLARIYRENTRSAGAETSVAGTLAYMAPEQLHSPEAVDRRADIYAFGLLMYELLSGKNPLLQDAVPEQIRAILNTVPERLSGVPEELATIIARCLEKDADDRPRDFPDVLAHLASLARTLSYDWHLDLDSIEPPRASTALTIEGPMLRPRRPRAGEPFAMELKVRGDVGPGPVELSWTCPPIPGLELLTPNGREVLRVDVGGRIDLDMRIRAVADGESTIQLPRTTLSVEGPVARVRHPVPLREFAVDFAFHLPLVGRDKELAALQHAVDDLIEGDGGLLLIEAERGAGRSRMLHECARLTAAANVRSVLSRAEGEAERPLRLLNDTARELLSISRGEASSVRAMVNEVLGHEPRSARYFAEVLLGGVPLDRDTPVLQHWITLLRAATADGPLVLFLDDLHRADEAVGRVCFEIAARAQEEGLPVLVVATAASGLGNRAARERLEALREGIRLWDRCGAFVRRMELQPLSRSDIEQLVESVFPGHPFAEEAPWFLRTLHEATAGNPFHLSEILRMLRRGDVNWVMQEDGEFRLDPSCTPEDLRELVPAELDAAVRRRLENLDPDSFEVAALAALIGEEFDTDVLRVAVDDDERVEASLVEWERRGIVRPVDGDLDRYRFWSSVVPPVMRRMLDERAPQDRRRLHGRIADALVSVYRDKDRVARRALGIAYHLRRAGRQAESVPFILTGCRRLLSLSLSERARQILEVAAPLMDAVEGLVRAQFDFLYGIACEDSGAYAKGRIALSDFLRVAEGLEGIRRRDIARAWRRLGRIEQAQGDYEDATNSYDKSRALLVELGDLRSVAFLHTSRADLAMARGRLALAQREASEARRIAEEQGNEGAAIQTLIVEGRIDIRLGRSSDAGAKFRDAEKRSDDLGDRRRRAAALMGLAQVDLTRGYTQQARGLVREAIELHAVMGDRSGLADALLLLGSVYRESGRTDLALQSFRRAQRVFREVGRPEGEGDALLQAGRILRMRTKTTTAVRDLAAAAEKFTRLGLDRRSTALAELAVALAESGANRAALLALARADRAAPQGFERRTQRVLSSALRARLAMGDGDLRKASVYATRARQHSARDAGHGARIVGHRIAAEVAQRAGNSKDARRWAETALAFARESGHTLEAAAAERVLLEIDARAGKRADVDARSHRIAQLYAHRGDVAAEPWRLLESLRRGYETVDARRSAGYARAAARCHARLESLGFRARM